MPSFDWEATNPPSTPRKSAEPDSPTKRPNSLLKRGIEPRPGPRLGTGVAPASRRGRGGAPPECHTRRAPRNRVVAADVERLGTRRRLRGMGKLRAAGARGCLRRAPAPG
jgi:hypothetical protein